MTAYVSAVVMILSSQDDRVDLPRLDGSQGPVALKIGRNLSPSCEHLENGLTVVRLDAQALDELSLPRLNPRNVIVGGTLENENRQLTEDDILPGFRIVTFQPAGTGYAALLRRGDSIVGITSAQSFTQVPQSASIANVFGGSDSGSDTLGGEWTINSPFTSATMAGTIRRLGTNGGADPTWTAVLTAVGATTQQALVTVTYTSDIYWGMVAAVPTDSAGVQALGSSELSQSVTREVTLTGTNLYFVYAYPAAMPDPSYRFKEGQFGIAMDASAVTVNRNGVSRSYTVKYSHARMTLAGDVVEVFR